MDGSVLEGKSSLKMLGLTFYSKLDWVSYIISIGKTAFKKIGTLILSMKFLSPKVALYLYKSTIHPCMKYKGVIPGIFEISNHFGHAKINTQILINLQKKPLISKHRSNHKLRPMHLKHYKLVF